MSQERDGIPNSLLEVPGSPTLVSSNGLCLPQALERLPSMNLSPFPKLCVP